ncbi:MAG: methyltetrahydrofolate cobalamin methyltransferase [Thermodesulfobacteriota bacterium]
MILIGEKINGTRKQVGQAIKERNRDLIQQLAIQQVEAGADWLDVNAGIGSEREKEDLIWLVQTVQEVTDRPLCLDSANSEALIGTLSLVKKTPMINSVSGEKKRRERLLPLISDRQCPVIMLAMDDQGIPKTVEERITIINWLIEEARDIKVKDELMYIDPLVMALSVNTESGKMALQTIEAIKERFPEVHVVSGLSNVSFGLPARSLINRTFLALAIQAGLDAAILDPLDKGLRSVIRAAELILGQDRYCLNYIKAYRAGELVY